MIKQIFLTALTIVTIDAKSQIMSLPLDGNTNDISGHNNNGIIHGNVTPANNRLGQPNTCYHFPGTQNDFIYIAPSWTNYDFNITQTDSFSVSLWMQPENNNLNQYAFAKRDTLWSTSQASDFDITINQAVISSRFNINYTADYNDYNSAMPQNWYNVVITYSNGLSKLYVNDTLRGSNPSSPIDSIAPIVLIGQYFKGEIDDINFFHKALTAIEVDNLYRTGSTTGIKDLNNLNGTYTIYPNPSNDFISIKSLSSNAFQIELIDVLGNSKALGNKSSTETSFDLTGNPKGMYFLKITNEKKSETFRIIIN
jgi:hypothetical protein